MKKKRSAASGLLLFCLVFLSGCSWSIFGKPEIQHDFMEVVPELPPDALLQDCGTLSMEQLITMLESLENRARNIDIIDALVSQSAAITDCSLDKGALRAWKVAREKRNAVHQNTNN